MEVSKNVKFINIDDGTVIFSDKATYLRNDEIIFTEGNSKALNKNNSITATNFKFDKNKNILNASEMLSLLMNQMTLLYIQTKQLILEMMKLFLQKEIQKH